jgi:NAD(P)H-nitrite reductase large subunit
MSESYVIVGDGIAGSSAAETIRERDPTADITVLTDEGEPLYNRILTKEFAKGKLPEGPISIHEPEWYEERDIDLELNAHVSHIDTDADELYTHDGSTYEYHKLLIATGGTPTQLPVENSDAEGIHHFWTFQDARQIKAHAEETDTGLIVGAGLLGIDLAAICGAQDVEAHYLMRGNRWWRYGLSEAGASIIHEAMEDIGINLVFDSGVDHFEVDDAGHVTGAVDPNGDRYAGDFVGVAIGLNFNTEFLHNTPVKCENGIFVDEYMQTTVDNIYAAGDITRFHDVILGERTQNGAWGSAKEQGSVAGHNMIEGQTEEFRWVPTYSITHFDFPFLSFGHPTEGETYIDRTYADQEWRRLALKDGKLIGGVLIGDLSQQSAYKQLIREEREVADAEEALLEQQVDLESLAAPKQS